MEIKKRRNRKINIINLRIENQDKNLELLAREFKSR